MKNIIKLFAIALIAVIGVQCFSDWEGDAATITISLGADTNARAVGVAYPPDEEILLQLEHRIHLQGPTGSQDHTVSNGETRAVFSVVPGLWEISIEARLENVLYAVGSNSVTVRAGRANTVVIEMIQYIVGIDEFVYTLINNDAEYRIRKGTVTGGDVVIPAAYLGKPVTEIASSAFENCAGITSVTIPASVTSIGNYAFSGCTGLTGVIFEGSGTAIGDNAFPEGSNGDGGNTLQTAYNNTSSKAGTYMRASGGSTWAKAAVIDVGDANNWYALDSLEPGNYIINITMDINNLSSNGDSNFGNNPVNVIINGNGHTLTLSGNGTLLQIRRDKSGEWAQTLTMNNLILEGHSNNNRPLVQIPSDCTFIMNGGEIRGNTNIGNDSYNWGGSGVFVDGTFIMNSGEIKGNTTDAIEDGSYVLYDCGGGVHVGQGYDDQGATFIMNGGIISDNKNIKKGEIGFGGGGVFIDCNGTFIMNGGEITRNSAVYMSNGVELDGGKGGGVYIMDKGTFIMNGGEISANTTGDYSDGIGGGVYVCYYDNSVGIFRIINGTVYGSNAAVDKANTAASGTALFVEDGSIAQCGTFIGSDAWKNSGVFTDATWNNASDLTTTSNTIRMQNGATQ